MLSDIIQPHTKKKKHAMIPNLCSTERSQLLRDKVEWWFARGSNEG